MSLAVEVVTNDDPQLSLGQPYDLERERDYKRGPACTVLTDYEVCYEVSREFSKSCRPVLIRDFK